MEICEFVSFSIAKKLKEKGFIQGFNIFGYRLIYSDKKTIKFISEIDAYESDYFGENVSCPTISQVLKWLREEKQIHICIDIYDDGWFFDVSSFYKSDTGVYEIELPYKSSNVTPDYESYEEAALAGIKYVLDNLI